MSETIDPNDPGLKKILPSGQQEKYLILSDQERAKGFIRPLRKSYMHVACGGVTTMGLSICETYARDPKFYNGTFCVKCGRHFRLIDEQGKPAFLWDEDGMPVGS